MKQRTPDGRVQRAERGRQRVSEALVALVVKTGRMPSVEEVAARAGVGRRSVFRYFDGVQALELETARAMRSRMTEQVPPPAPSGSLDARLAALVRHRARLYERITPIRRFLDAARHRGNPTLDAFIDDGRQGHPRDVFELRRGVGRFQEAIRSRASACVCRLGRRDLSDGPRSRRAVG